MPTPHNHYHASDLRTDLRKIGQEADAEELAVLDEAMVALARKRRELYNAMLAKHRQALKPVLRPCHQKRLDELDVYTTTWY